MRVQALGCAIVMVAFSLTSCEAATQLQTDDDMAPGNGSAGAGPGAGSCAGCYDSTCAWQSADCAGDPECARWMTCARPCAPSDGNTPATSCLDACPEPSSHVGAQLRDALTMCMGRSGGCCSGGSKDVDSGSSPTDAPDAMQMGGFDGDAQASYLTQCDGVTCKDCLLSIKGNVSSCVADDTTCTDSVTACMHEAAAPGAPYADLGSCANFMLGFAGCATDPSFQQHTVAQCVWVVPPGSVETTLDVIRCGAMHCSVCAPSGEELCVACQIDACRFEMAALLGDADAQGLYWCLRKCSTSSDVAACRGACGGEYPNGVPVLTALNQCVAGSCADKCQN